MLRPRLLGALLVAGGLSVLAASASCAATPTAVPIRTFELPQKVAFVCLQTTDPVLNVPAPIVPEPELYCPPTPKDSSGNILPVANHYFALVTQTARGELAVVDLTNGYVVDEDYATPQTNFIPVGPDPVDLVVAPVPVSGPPGTPLDPTLGRPSTFVATASDNSFALYAIDDTRLLGDSAGVPPGPAFLDGGVATRLTSVDGGAAAQPPLRLTDLLACSLPQPPSALGIIPGLEVAEAGAPAAAAPVGCRANYTLSVVLQPWAGSPGQVVMVNPTPLICAGQIPGALPPCTLLGATGALSVSVAGASLSPGAAWPDGVPYADAGDLGSTEPKPGGATCPAAAVPALTSTSSDGGSNANSDAAAGLAVDAGVLDADGLEAAVEAGEVDSEIDGNPPDAGSMDAVAEAALAADANLLQVDAGMASDAQALSVGPLTSSQPASLLVRDDAPIAYVADFAVPLIHIIDVSHPSAPVEVSSFVATSQAQPTRRVQLGAMALSPATRTFDPVSGLSRRYLYAIDENDGTVMIFDATAPVPPPFTPPMQRPHSELNPMAPRDRLTFAAPAATLTFARHDWPLFLSDLPTNSGSTSPSGYTGLLCNPNGLARSQDGQNTILPTGTPEQLGAYYSVDQAALIQPQGSAVQGWPSRLRGIFAFVTLTNGNIVVVDVEDWDAPCRRPDPLAPNTSTGSLCLPEPEPASPSDLDPYHAPFAFPNGPGLDQSSSTSAVTQEVFFPVSSPNRVRSAFLLRDDPSAGKHFPYLNSTPQLLSSTGAPVSGVGISQPIMLAPYPVPGTVDPVTYTDPTSPTDQYYATATTDAGLDAQAAPAQNEDGQAGDAQVPGAAPNASGIVRDPNVAVSYEDPTAHVDQDWTVTYEGALPTTSPLVADLEPSDPSYQAMVLTSGGPSSGDAVGQPGGPYCRMGIEDWAVGQDRARVASAEMSRLGLSVPSTPLAQWTSDYVEITDDLLASTDPYWAIPTASSSSESGAPTDSCWNWEGLDLTGGAERAADRYGNCEQIFGAAGFNADNQLARDFPILEAYPGSLVLGRFGWVANPPGVSGVTQNGNPIPESTANRVVVGKDPSNATFLREAVCCFHHQVGFKVRTGAEWSAVGQNGIGFMHHIVADPATGRCIRSCDPHDALLNARTFDVSPSSATGDCAATVASAVIQRSSPLAMRNPVFSFVMWSACTGPSAAGDAGSGAANSLFGIHTPTARDLSWRFSMRGGFIPETILLTGGQLLPVVPQSMAYAAGFQQLAVIDGSYQGLVMIDLNTLSFAHTPYF